MAVSEPAESQRPASGVKVLVIDPSLTVRRSAEELLSQAGCEVILAQDGFEALAMITDHRPDVIFADILTPKLDGYRLCALVKQNARYAHTRVVLLSSSDGVFDRVRARMVRADDYLSKPFTREALLKMVEAHARAEVQA